MRKLLIIGCSMMAFASFAQDKGSVAPLKPETTTTTPQKVGLERGNIERVKMDNKALNQRLKSAEMQREYTPATSAPQQPVKKD